MENEHELAKGDHESVQSDTPPPSSAEHDADATPRKRRLNALLASLAAILGLSVITMLIGGLETLAKDVMRWFEPARVTEEAAASDVDAQKSVSATFTFAELDIHPDLMFQPYTSGSLLGSEATSSTARMIREFRALLDLYEERQGRDDNFTIRVVDSRTNELLELYELKDERAAFESREEGDSWNWDRVDQMRRTATRNLVRKYSARGIPLGAITVKWGRRNQVLEARERELPYIEYEMRLARYLGLSLLATEIGTVETFNDDRAISPVGARSRYQMMPYTLRQNDIHHYSIATAAGNAIDVREEWHPLLTMEPALVTAAGYKNAVGHEIPGISAYHTGPGNIYSVYRMFLTADEALFSPASTVMDAYMWAVTMGYDEVSRNSSFKSYSRGYVASAYGSLRATEALPIDTTNTIRTERVQIRPGEQIFLSELLRTLEESDRTLDWGPDTDDLTPYARFARLNPHFQLPEAPGDVAGVAPKADLRLVSKSQGVPVRFFLPLGAEQALRDAGVDVLDRGKTFRYTHDTYGRPNPSEITIWDRQYEDLVREIMHFEFTTEHRERLRFLVDRFEDLAEANPSHYRLTQLKIIRTHARMWGSEVFEKLASAVKAARGSARFEPRPPSELPSPSFSGG